MEWWIDNGEIKHVTNYLGLFSSFDQFDSCISIKAARKESLNAVERDTINVICTALREITLNDVWYVPNIFKNLFRFWQHMLEIRIVNFDHYLQNSGVKLMECKCYKVLKN